MYRLTLLILFSLCLIIPARAQDMLTKMRSDQVITIDEKEYYLHEVKKGQTLYMISKAYGVEVNDIIRENPDVKEGLKSGMKLRIPRKEDQNKKKVKPLVEEQKYVKEPALVTMPVPEAEFPPCGQDKSNMKGSYNIALMLPLFLNEVVPIDVNEVSEEAINKYKPLRFLPFYEGFMMAVDSLRKSGFKLKIYVYDVGQDTVKTRKLLRNPEIKNMDLIIGLLYHRTFQIVADFAERNEIPIVNPMSERDQVINNNPFVIKVRPSLKSQAEHLASYITANYSGSNIVLLKNIKEKIGTLPDTIRDRIHATNATSYTDAISHFRKDTSNVLVLFSENKSFILDVVTKIHEVRGDYNITLIGLPRWDMVDGIEADYLVNLKAHILAPYFIQYEDENVKKFVRNYQDQYKTDPDFLAFQGFDIAWYFSNALKLYGTSFQRCLPGLQIHSMQAHFEFRQNSPKNGYENRHWEIYYYDNYRLRVVN